MKTDLKTDIFIYNDDSADLKRSQAYVDVNVDDAQLKEYYNSIINTKLAYEALKGSEKFLFYQYFFLGFELDFLARMNGQECTPEQQAKLRTTLASACCGFAKALGAPYEADMFMSVDAFKHNVRGKRKNEAYEFVYLKVKEYNDFVNRTILAMCI